MSGEIQSYRDLTAWQKGMDLAEQVYAATRAWPRLRRRGAMRRRGVEVPQRHNASRLGASGLHHLSIARGSLHEMETQLLLAQRLGYIPGEQTTYLLALSDEVGRLVAGLIRSLRR